MKSRWLRSFVALGIVAAGVGHAQPASRTRPPLAFACDRNDLAVYTGVVTRYRRQTSRTTLTLRTDADTTE